MRMRHRWVAALVLSTAAGAVSLAACRGASPPKTERIDARVTTLDMAPTAPRAYARRGDLILHGSSGTSLTVAAAPDLPGHRPLRGAIVDVGIDGAKGSDPLLWWRAGWVDAGQKLHPLVASAVSASRCAEPGIGQEGVRIEGDVDGVHLATDLCALADGRYRVRTVATGLPPNAVLADDLNTGIVDVAIDQLGAEWEGDSATRFLVLSGYGIGVAIEAPAMRARSKRIRIAGEIFPAPIAVLYEGAEATRTVHVVRGDAFDALAALPFSTRKAAVGLADGRGGHLALCNAAGQALVKGVLPPGPARTVRLPEGLGESFRVRDAHGVPAPERVPVSASSGEPGGPRLVAVPSGQLDLRFTDGRGGPIAAHVLLRGLAGTPDPAPEMEKSGRAYPGGRSVYLLDGAATVHLAPGRYAVTATHGPMHAVSRREVDIAAGGVQSISDSLAAVIDTHEWTTADFHLHAAPSPDSSVSLEARLASLVSEGIDLAVATDHNHVTDYEPLARELKLSQLATVRGDEITSAGSRLWGHFNAFPLPAPTRAAEEAVPPYYDIPPAELFARARDAGARVVQVNHARMPPQIGYFDLTHLDPATGAADPEFADDFDALEAYNGLWIETPEKVREGARDLVALARRGRRPIATGNSDSHRLLYEEAGYPRTFVHTPAGSPSDRAARAIEALRSGDTTVSSGPLVTLTVDGKWPGSVVRPRSAAGSKPSAAGKGEVLAHVRVLAPAWVPVETVEIWVNDDIAARFEAGPARDGVRFERDVPLKVDADAAILAWAEARTPLGDVLPNPDARAIGFTGLVYVDADGDGRVKVPPRNSSPLSR
ncbi:CehA/McbA family metallohydrolase [Pendulispora albinea]|uniref:CehA/McbA family metallohydrolase n=1 Tax=Pendulispora albinea TaxID=2741071 RepID=A0ABZ2M9L6_9BACT